MLLPTLLILGTLAVVAFLAWFIKTPSRFSKGSDGKTVHELKGFFNYGFIHPIYFVNLPTPQDQPGYLKLRNWGVLPSSTPHVWVGAPVHRNRPNSSYRKVIFYGAKASPLLDPSYIPRWGSSGFRFLSDLSPNEVAYIPPSKVYENFGRYYLRLQDTFIQSTPRAGFVQVRLKLAETARVEITKGDLSARYFDHVNLPTHKYYEVHMVSGTWEDKGSSVPPKPLTLYDHLLEDC